MVGSLDTLLTLRDSSGNIISSDNDSGIGLGRVDEYFELSYQDQIIFTPTTTGEYFVDVSSNNGISVGVMVLKSMVSKMIMVTV